MTIRGCRLTPADPAGGLAPVLKLNFAFNFSVLADIVGCRESI